MIKGEDPRWMFLQWKNLLLSCHVWVEMGDRGEEEKIQVSGRKARGGVTKEQLENHPTPTPIPLEPDILQVSATFKVIESRHCSNREKSLVVLQVFPDKLVLLIQEEGTMLEVMLKHTWASSHPSPHLPLFTQQPAGCNCWCWRAATRSVAVESLKSGFPFQLQSLAHVALV